MANHVQDQILSYIQSLLAGAGTSAGSNVFIERADPLTESALPAIEIEAGPAEVRQDQGSIGFPRTEFHFFEFTTRCTVQAAVADYRVGAGNLAKQVQAAINASRTTNSAGGLARNGIQLQRLVPNKDSSGSKPAYSIELVWVAGYTAASNTPDVAI